MAEQQIGRVTHYFGKIGVAAIELTDGSLALGDTIHVKGHTTDFYQKIESMQMEHAPVPSAKIGESFGLEVESQVRQHDLVYKSTED